MFRSILTNIGMFYTVDITANELLGIKDIKVANCMYETEIANLDPGGMLYIKSPLEGFTIGSTKFDIRLDKVCPMLRRIIDYTKDMGPYKAFPSHIGHMVVRKEIIEPLVTKLQEMQKTDAVLHANLDFDEAIEKCTYVVKHGKYKNT